MEIIVDHKKCKVFFDTEKNVFVKRFYPKFENRLKFFLRFRRYPGENFRYISEELRKIGVKVPQIVSSNKYEVITKKIEGVILSKYFDENGYDDEVVKEFLNIIVRILNSNIYFGDFNTSNFIFSDGEIFAIDLEDYRKEKLLKRDKNEALRRLKKTLKNDKWYRYVINLIEEE